MTRERFLPHRRNKGLRVGAELVPEAANRYKQLGFRGVGFDLRAQPADMNVDGPLIDVSVCPPNAVQQSLPVENDARAPSQEDQECELLGREIDLLTAVGNFMARFIDHDVPDLNQ